MIIKCDICGYEFDYKDAQLSDCGCSCGEPRPKCPECGLDIILPAELELEEEEKRQKESLFSKIEKELQ